MICDLGAHPLAKDAVHLYASSVSSTRRNQLLSSQKLRHAASCLCRACEGRVSARDSH